MMGIDCSKCTAENGQGSCCGVFPMDLDFIEKHKDKIQKSGTQYPTNDGKVAIVTDDLACIFLNRETKKCMIYDERPQVCRDYGMIDELLCPCFKKNGNPRSLASRKQVERAFDKKLKLLEKKNGRVSRVR